jgi:predicted metalloprotease
VGLSQPQISRDLEEIDKILCPQDATERTKRRVRLLSKMRHAEKEFWDAWERSKQDKETSTKEKVLLAGNASGHAGKGGKTAKNVQGQQGDPGDQGPVKQVAGSDKTSQFVKKVLDTTEAVWGSEFQKMGKTYSAPRLNLFSDRVRTGCGVAPAAVGPFYCPADRTVYLDPTFFDELEMKLGGSKAEFSQAYVIAHEVGHHIQNLLGYNSRRGTMEEHDFSVRLELQADYLAGVWAYHGNKMFRFIEAGDVESAIKSASAIGDDRLQRRAGGFVHPEKFTHGTSNQRVRWFRDGLETGDAGKEKLDTFFTIGSSKDL